MEAPTLARVLVSPVFLFELDSVGELSQAENDFIAQHVTQENGVFPKWVPFPIFRLCFRVGFDQWWFGTNGKSMVWRFLYENNDGPSVIFLSQFDERPNANNSLHIFHDFKPVSDEALKHAEVVSSKGTKSPMTDEQTLKNVMWSPMNQLRDFLFTLQSSAFTTLKVEPPEKQGKTVHWRLARTHYCILKHEDAQASQKRLTGPTEHEINRAAHWRRAHLRRLMSDKFTHKKGTIIQIKHAWVGPSEWVGLDKKIYKVTEFSA